MPPIDLLAVRARFPALAGTDAFLDGPGGSQVPDAVGAAMTGYLYGHNANLGGVFPTSVSSESLMDEARRAAADFVGGSPNEIAFGPNMSTLNFLLAHAVARTLEPGDEIITTVLDHDANISPWLQVAEDSGCSCAPCR